MSVKLHWYPVILALALTLFAGFVLGNVYVPDIIHRENNIWVAFVCSWGVAFFIWLAYDGAKRDF